MAVTEPQVLLALSSVQEPELGGNIVARKMVKDIAVRPDGSVSFTIELTTPACPQKDKLEYDARAAVMNLPGVTNVEVKFDAKVIARGPRGGENLIPGVKNTVAIASGKGGVGKTTIAVNTAVALAQAGAAVGLLDADITGPNVPLMLGARQPVTQRGGKIVPVESHGVRMMSLAFFSNEQTPVIWRGPLIHGAIRQFLTDVDWGALDYLVIDLPPGTSDAQLSISQLISPTGAVIVSTPQDVSLMDATRSLTMFKQVNVPLLGMIENMSFFVCPHCGERTDIFGHGGAEAAAERLGVPFLGAIPLDPAIRVGGDTGTPILVSHPGSATAVALREAAQRIAGRVSQFVVASQQFR